IYGLLFLRKRFAAGAPSALRAEFLPAGWGWAPAAPGFPAGLVPARATPGFPAAFAPARAAFGPAPGFAPPGFAAAACSARATALRIARVLFRISWYSRSGVESATSPAPAWI